MYPNALATLFLPIRVDCVLLLPFTLSSPEASLKPKSFAIFFLSDLLILVVDLLPFLPNEEASLKPAATAIGASSHYISTAVSSSRIISTSSSDITPVFV